MLEEVEYLETEGVWLITVGFDVPASARTPIQMLHLDGVQFVRHYKRVKIHNQTGEPLSVHIRKLD